jgi:hypothetical protein
VSDFGCISFKRSRGLNHLTFENTFGLPSVSGRIFPRQHGLNALSVDVLDFPSGSRLMNAEIARIDLE